jgi:hypothetical protein
MTHRLRAGPAGYPRAILAAGWLAVVLAGCGSSTASAPPLASTAASGASASCASAQSAYRTHRSELWLIVSARVTRDLSDAHGTYTHQRFIVACSGGFTLLIVNDISIGTRAPARVGDTVTVRGQYIWNEQGGLIHFTHHDPEGGIGGYIAEDGTTYS